VIHLAPRPGTNAAVALGLAHVVRRDGLTDSAFIAQRTEGYDTAEELIESYTPDAVEEITGIPADDLVAAAHVYGEANAASILWGPGVTEHKYDSEVVQLLCNLAMMTGNIGKAAAALLPLRGQNNVQGSSDMGALPDTYTAYRRVDHEETAQLFEEAWGVPLSRNVGYKIPEMFDAAVAGDLKTMYIFGEDIAQTDPDTAHVIKAMESLDFVVCQEIFENETTKYADVILPASAFLEKDGTFINAERRFQLVEAAIDPPGGARTDFDIITTVSRMLGHEMGWETPWDALDEIARLTPTYQGVGKERTSFDNPTGKGQFAVLPYKAPATRLTTSSRWCWSPGACSSTTTPGR
jgi:formate dehydrogenase major subunit